MVRQRASHGWQHLTAEDKRLLLDAIIRGTPSAGPFHAELNLTDRCNVACYFCNQQDLRTKEHLSYAHIENLLHALVRGGLRSVRMSGGGDPLFHPDVARVMDLLERSGVIIDNLTTNGVGLTGEIAERLVRSAAREVIVSLNASSAYDYKRMMKVRGDRFDVVVANVRNLLATRGAGPHPAVVLQFLIDRQNAGRLMEMYALGMSLDVDVIAIGTITDVPGERIDSDLLLTGADASELRPLVAELLEADRNSRRLEIGFQVPALQRMLEELSSGPRSAERPDLAPAESFRRENGACFFTWYSTVIRGNGDLHACCFMQSPAIAPLDEVRTKTFEEAWNGSELQRARAEMRDVLLTGGDIPYSRARFKKLEPFCVQQDLCYLKNVYFRSDDGFYSELASRLETARRREVRFLGRAESMKRAAERAVARSRFLSSAFDRLRESSRPLRRTVSRLRDRWKAWRIARS